MEDSDVKACSYEQFLFYSICHMLQEKELYHLDYVYIVSAGFNGITWRRLTNNELKWSLAMYIHLQTATRIQTIVQLIFQDDSERYSYWTICFVVGYSNFHGRFQTWIWHMGCLHHSVAMLKSLRRFDKGKFGFFVKTCDDDLFHLIAGCKTLLNWTLIQIFFNRFYNIPRTVDFENKCLTAKVKELIWRNDY